MRGTRLFALLLTLLVTLAASAVPAAAATETSGRSGLETARLLDKVREAPAFSDVDAALWCADAVATVCETGLLEGYNTGTFGPDNLLTNAHIAAVCARLIDLLGGGDGNIPLIYDDAPWYAGYYAYLDGVLGTGYALRMETPEEPCSRASFARVLHAAAQAAGVTLPEINAGADAPDTDGFLDGGAVRTLYRAGILTGTDAYGTFDGEAFLTRGQTAAMLARLVNPAERVTFTLKPFDLCRYVLGLDPQTVLLTADGQSLTAEEFGPQLVISLLQWGSQTTDRARSDAVRILCAYTLAPSALASSLHVSLSAEEEAAVQVAAAREAGCFGFGEGYYTLRQRAVSLGAALESWYITRDPGGKTAASLYHSALEDAAERISAQAAPALTALDLPAVRARALAVPLRDWLSIPG